MLKNKIKNNVNILKNFGLKYAIYDFFSEFIFRKDNKVGHIAHYNTYNNAKKYLKKKYNYLIEEYKYKNPKDEKISENSPIFIFWWQGEKNLPAIVESCINSIKRNAEMRPVYFITQYNYYNYVEIPDYIIEKVNSGIITITHFADILRMALLYEYGGIWLDATIYLTKPINKEICNYSFFTVKHNLFSDWHICKGMWSTNVLCCGKNNLAIKFFRDMLFEYCKIEKYFLCYLLIDCIIAIGYENIEFIKKQIDLVPINNENTLELYNRLFMNLYDNYEWIKNNNTYIYKFKVKEKNINNTIYEKIILKEDLI